MPPSSPPSPPAYSSTVDSQTVYLQRARNSLRQALNRYTAYFRAARDNPPQPATQTMLKTDMERLTVTLNKLENSVARVAVFGLVSRGKSAVLNALLGQKVLPTGPLNGVTLTPQAVVWRPYAEKPNARSQPLDDGRLETVGVSGRSTAAANLQIELIDTPGLDEIDGQTRAEMAQTIARQSDLILFVVAGDITRTEFQALCELRQAQKPLLLVFNKIDLYPEQSRQAIHQSLQRLASTTPDGKLLQRSLTTNEIVLIAAEPAPLQVRVEQPDGRMTYEWESPPPIVDALKGKILEVLQQEGRTLMALNALVQVQAAEARLADKIIEVHQPAAEELIWKFVRYKAIAIAINPIAVLDLVGGAVSDLAMIRALSNLYGLPITGHEAAKLWRTILLSSGSLLLTEVGSGLVLGLGKSAAAAATGVDSATGLTAYAGTAIAQAGFAGFGSYAVGRAAQIYLENGCSWGPQGASTTIQGILQTLDTSTILYRIRQDLSDRLG